MITSTSNQQMKNLSQLMKKAKTRKEQGLFVVEGRKMFQEVPKAWVRQVYASESFVQENESLMADCTYELEQPSYGLSDLLCGEKTHLLILESIQDPGNLGTMLRTGEGAGITGVIMNRTTVDLFNPKTIRSTMGSIYRMPYVVTDDLSGTIKELQADGVKVYAAHLKGTMQYDEPDYTGASAFLIGNEGNGLTDEIADLADTYIKIPMCGQVESLNAAISATLLMYEANRQRRHAEK